jgi:hypothetical protein
MASVTGDGNGEGEAMGAAIFGGEEGEEVRWLHGAEGRRHIEERRGGPGGWRLEVEYDQRKSMGRMCGWAKLLIRPMKKIWLIV